MFGFICVFDLTKTSILPGKYLFSYFCVIAGAGCVTQLLGGGQV